MNNNSDKDHFYTCNTCEEFYNESLDEEDFEPTINTDLSVLIQEAQLELTKAQASLAYEQVKLTKKQIKFFQEYNEVIKKLIDILKDRMNKSA